MRANIPASPEDATNKEGTESQSPPSLDLQGTYLRAMQDISAHLMEALPAEESLWRILAQTESLLMEAQLTKASLHDVFGTGGVAGFCQSIVDEYNRSREGQPRRIPAAADRSLRKIPVTHEPRGGANYYRKRRATAALIVAFSLLFLFLAAWYTGFLRYLTKGSAYYLDELYHFDCTIASVSDESMSFTIPLSPATDINRILYANADGSVLTLTDLHFTEKLHEINDGLPAEEGNGEPMYRKSNLWYVRIQYPVNAGYFEVSYIEPGNHGTATITLPNGEIITTSIILLDSGSSGKGYEYIELEVADIYAATDTEGSVLSVTIDPPQSVTWKRVGAGPRS